ncbi:AraC-type DNA-binding protein [Zhouia amylolytica]|uniref:AraC-type DNA-binding protein n=1 Tax=Zhouia amylolytica TaxID=376730 RepID=A0A1I6ULZ6_9FLAO|nr:AraC family transcriptional regulator [Zhouia amylolytica]SFT02441.1 AraC-type DNA-binding protein [Zhouia amylolytica]
MSVLSGFLDRLFLLFGSIGVVLSLTAGVVLVNKSRSAIKSGQNAIWNIFLAVYLLTFGIRMAKSLFHYYYTINSAIHTLFLSLFFAIGPSLWLYTLTISQPAKKFRPAALYVHYLALLLAVLLIAVIPEYGTPNAWMFYLTLFVHGFIYCIYTLFWIRINKDIYTKDEKGKKLKNWLLLLNTATLVIWSNAVGIYFGVIPFYPGSALVFTMVMIVLISYMLKHLWLLYPLPQKYKGSELTPSFISTHEKQLEQLMDEEKLFLHQELTLQKLSERMKITSKQLSQLINQTADKNYSLYISELRVQEAIALMKNEKYKDYKIAAIAYESGFNSISSFNAVFKKITGQTPVAYRNSLPEATN